MKLCWHQSLIQCDFECMVAFGKEHQKVYNLSRSFHILFKRIATVLFSIQLIAIITEHLDIKSVELNIKQNHRVKTS